MNISYRKTKGGNEPESEKLGYTIYNPTILTIGQWQHIKVSTGLIFTVPEDIDIQVRNLTVNLNNGIIVHNTIDANQSEFVVTISNLTPKPIKLLRNEKLCRIVFVQSLDVILVRNMSSE